MSTGAIASTRPEKPPMVNRKTKAMANSMGVSKVIEPFHIVATQLKTFTPVGTAISMVENMKNSSAAAGMPRRIPDYALQFTEFNQIATVGAFIFGFSQLLFLAVVLKTVKGGEKASSRVWEGAEGLEWTLPSPAPYHTFETAPVVK